MKDSICYLKPDHEKKVDKVLYLRENNFMQNKDEFHQYMMTKMRWLCKESLLTVYKICSAISLVFTKQFSLHSCSSLILLRISEHFAERSFNRLVFIYFLGCLKMFK